MKPVLFVLAVSASLLAGCGVASNLKPLGENQENIGPKPGDKFVAVKDQTVAIVSNEGIKIFYTLMGSVDRIEVYGIADAWKGDRQTHEILAEADAKERLVKYLYDQRVNSSRSVEITAKSLDKARDDALSRIKNGFEPYEIVAFNEETVEQEVISEETMGTRDPPSDNASRRIAQRVEETKIAVLTQITSGGTLRGMRKIRSEVRNDGRTYVAVYQWSEKDQGTANEIRRRMLAK